MHGNHFMRPAYGDTYPSCLVCLALDGSTVVQGKRPVIRAESLKSWSASGVELSGGHVKKTWASGGQTAAGFWEAAEWPLRRHKLTWIVIHGAARGAALLGMWDAVEAGRVTIGDAPAKPVAGTKNRGSQASQGFCVLEDPPTIVQCRMVGIPGSMQLLDIRNYGITGYPAESPAPERAAWLKDVMLRMIEVLRVNQWGSLRTTAAAQAMYTFRRRYLRDTILCHRQPDALAVEKASLYGGRCECRRLGKVAGELYHVDFRSLYPSICANTALPVVLRECVQPTSEYDEPLALDTSCTIATVIIRTDEPAYPVRNGRLTIWPVGTFETTLCGPELEDALCRRRVISVRTVVRYSTAQALAELSLAVWGQTCCSRKSGDVPLVAWLKSLSVSLPGKFGQHGGLWVRASNGIVTRPWREWYTADGPERLQRHRSLGWEHWIEKGDKWADEAVPAMAAWITSAARVVLLGAIRCAGWENVYYHDTDSLIVSAAGWHNLCHDGRIKSGDFGALRLVGKHALGHFEGIKHYSLDGELKCAGMPKGDTAAGPYEGSFWYRCQSKRDIKRGRAPVAREVLRTYNRAQPYRHGNVGPDGIVRPIQIGDL